MFDKLKRLYYIQTEWKFTFADVILLPRTQFKQ